MGHKYAGRPNFEEKTTTNDLHHILNAFGLTGIKQ